MNCPRLLRAETRRYSIICEPSPLETNAVEALKIYLEHDREHRTALGKTNGFVGSAAERT